MEEIFGKKIDPKKFKHFKHEDIMIHIKNRIADSQKIKEYPQIINDKCLICGCVVQTRTYTVNNFIWAHCPDCDHIYKTKMGDYNKLVEFYRNDTVEIYLEKADIDFRIKNIAAPKIEFVLKNYKAHSTGKWLEIATGLGEVHYILKKMGWSTESTELNKSFVEFAEKNFDVSPQRVTLDEYYEIFKKSGSAQFDVISAFGYFDMLPDPLSHFKIINRMLKKNGLFGTIVPNGQSLTGALSLHKPDTCLRTINAVDFSYFSPKSVNICLEKSGFELVSVWWHGLDIHELIVRMIEADPSFADSNACSILYDNFNELQAVIDKARLSDSYLLCARKIKELE